jgi:hypothetical protein
MRRNERSSPRLSRICPQCEYDLTGLPEPCVCPECGRAIEAGHFSIEVWPISGKPSWFVIVSLGFFGMIMLLNAIGEMQVRAVRTTDLIRAMIGGLLLFAAAVEARKMSARLRGRTSITFHCSPTGVGVVERKRLMWFDWRHVRAVRCSKLLLGNTWILSVKGNATMSASLFKVVLPPSRRTAAKVRNTLRRHLRHWQQRQRLDNETVR